MSSSSRRSSASSCSMAFRRASAFCRAFSLLSRASSSNCIRSARRNARRSAIASFSCASRSGTPTRREERVRPVLFRGTNRGSQTRRRGVSTVPPPRRGRWP
jgi:hypothetical protein